MITKKEKELRNKIKFFLSKKTKVHVTKKDSMWLNGIITSSFKSNDCYLMQEDKLGTIYLFFNEILDVDQYTERVGEKA
jgi:hypothetical protein